ncbi:membrane protein insertase YidC [Anaerocolumna sedimenticola]|uniref:Membrane protein insertase YidC n=1 Tax=Anaerocolumna sedimenticola TaxID=2696063 RepID=A0A6P1TK55_9FIRM|nr:YidC/Oxa1 family membrane protein insertase [Anaerocolumna sedimenticola]QHQ60286.1 membrane protein insertase YidC [Anaerocolumna sedimenticola]
MFSIFLTQRGGILGPIESLLGWILNAIYEFLSLFGIQNVAIVIILFTFIVRGFMIPLTIKQQKFSKLSSKMNPEISKIQAKYKGKKDEVSLRKQQAETQAVYQKYGASPTAGCLPLLITLPIMFALYRVIYNIPAYVHDINQMYSNIAEAIRGTNGYVDIMTSLAEKVNVKASSFNEVTADGIISVNHVIDILSKFKSDQWAELKNNFPSLLTVIDQNYANISSVNRFIGGLNIIDAPGFSFPGILIPILAAGLQFIQGKQTQALNPTDKDNPMSSTMNTMNTVMPIMSGFFCFMLPIGVGIYWVAGSLFAIIQQFIINKHMEKVDVDALIEKNVMKANKRKAKLGIDPNASMEELAKKQTRSIEVPVENVNTSTSNYANAVKKNYEPSDYKKGDESYKAGSISAYANLLNNRNNNKGDK